MGSDRIQRFDCIASRTTVSGHDAVLSKRSFAGSISSLEQPEHDQEHHSAKPTVSTLSSAFVVVERFSRQRGPGPGQWFAGKRLYSASLNGHEELDSPSN